MVARLTSRAMTTSTSLSGRNLPPRPPLKGSFPLDHLGECASLADMYAACLRENDGAAGQCRAIARRYLECRMDAGLMAKTEMNALGLESDAPSKSEPDGASTTSPSPSASSNAEPRSEERGGFVAGLRTAKRRGSKFQTDTAHHASEEGNSAS